MLRGGPHLREQFLRHIWSRQFLRASDLRTTDGSPLEVLSPGELNEDGGPDFRNARIKIGAALFTGDVEIHRDAADWRQHGHHSDPAYNKVILHVVFETSGSRNATTVQSGRTVPVLALEPFLSEPLSSLWGKLLFEDRLHRAEHIRCAELNKAIPPSLLEPWIDRTAFQRLQLKILRFEERLRQLAYEESARVAEIKPLYGRLRIEGYPEEIPPPLSELTSKDLSHRFLWDQVLYEGIMDALGYSKNRRPFVRLAMILNLRQLRSLGAEDPLRREAALFGVAGLLPRIKTLKERQSREYVRALSRTWREMRRELHIGRLHEAEWQFFPTRPSNFPPVRISAAAGLIAAILFQDLFRSIVQTIKSSVSKAEKLAALRNMLKTEPIEFWKTHYAFDRPARHLVTPLGEARIADIIANSVLPLCLLYARIFKDRETKQAADELYRSFPPLADNEITRLMERQLLRGKMDLGTMSRQQGVIQLFKYYCREGKCAECDVGKVVFGLTSSAVSSSPPETEHYSE